MKIIDAQGAYPGIEDKLVEYAGKFTGTAHQYQIKTKCKTLLNVKISAYPTTVPRPASVIDVPYTIGANTSGFAYVQFTAQSGYDYYYDVKGVEEKLVANTDSELVRGTSATFDFTGYHTHDGINSPTIAGSDIYVGPTYAGYIAIVNSGGYLAFIPSTLTLPAAITLLKLEGTEVSTKQEEYQAVLPSSAGDIDIIWTPSGGSEGIGQGGNVKYKAYIDKFVPPEESGTKSGIWQALVNTDSDSSGVNAAVNNWDLNDAGELVENVLYRLYVVARNTVTGAQTVSEYGYFKLEEPSA